MKKIKNLLLVLFTTALLFGCNDSSKNDNSASTEPAKTTTFMVYAVGSDLESTNLLGSINMLEMIGASEGDTNTTIIMQTGAAKHIMENPAVGENQEIPVPVKDWSIIQLHKIYNGNLTTLEDNLGTSCIMGEEIPNCTPMNKGNITEFIKKAADYAPADRYVLILWNHGGGSIAGYGDQANSSTVIDIKNAVAASGIHFDIIGFDACLMSTLETAYALKDYADYFVGSEEVESGFGWNYEDFLQELSANSSISSKDLAVMITEKYQKKYTTEPMQDELYTLAAIDLKQIENLKNAFESYTGAMLKNIDGIPAWTKFNAARQMAEYYGDYAAIQILHVDIQDMAALSPIDGVSIDEAIKNAVISNKTDRPNSYGISAFIPYYYDFLHDTKNLFINAYELLYADMLPNNVQFAKHLVDLATPGLDENTITGTSTIVESGAENTTYSGDVNSDYGFREINILAYYKENNQLTAGTPFVESLNLTSTSLTDFNYNITARNGMMQFTNFDNTVTITPYAVNADIQPNQYKYAFPVFYANSNTLQCINESSAAGAPDSIIEKTCNIQKYVMEVTFDNNLNIINIDKGLKAYDSQNSKVAIQLNTGDAVFLNTASVGTTALEVAFNSNNKFTIQENITDTFKAQLVKQVNANKVEFTVYAINHAGGKKAIQYQQGINAKMDAEYKTDAEILVQAYTPRP